MKDKIKFDNINTYLTDKNGYISLLNKLDFLENLTVNDYTTVTLTDSYSNRLDLLARDFLGNKNLYFFIMWLNDLDDFKDTIEDELIGAGDGSLLNFNCLELDNYPLDENNFCILKYTISGVDFEVTDNSGIFEDSININSAEIDYTHGLLNLSFKSGKAPSGNITLTYRKNTNNLQSGKEIKIPTYDYVLNYFNTVKKERGLI
jgi:hypothetical protein